MSPLAPQPGERLGRPAVTDRRRGRGDHGERAGVPGQGRLERDQRPLVAGLEHRLVDHPAVPAPAFPGVGTVLDALEVDADSPTGADGLYESMGWVTRYRTESWHRDVRFEGTDAPVPQARLDQ